jgi:hypothetical protein
MSTFDLLYLMSLFLPPSKHIALNLMAHCRRYLLRVRQMRVSDLIREFRTWTKTHNSWLRSIVALQAAVASLHGRIILATTVRLLGEVIRLRVKLHPTALPLASADKICLMKSSKLDPFFLSNEANILRLYDHLGMPPVRSSGANRRHRLGASMRLWLAVRR